jgi:hypothetical protein
MSQMKGFVSWRMLSLPPSSPLSPSPAVRGPERQTLQRPPASLARWHQLYRQILSLARSA